MIRPRRQFENPAAAPAYQWRRLHRAKEPRREGAWIRLLLLLLVVVALAFTIYVKWNEGASENLWKLRDNAQSKFNEIVLTGLARGGKNPEKILELQRAEEMPLDDDDDEGDVRNDVHEEGSTSSKSEEEAINDGKQSQQQQANEDALTVVEEEAEEISSSSSLETTNNPIVDASGGEENEEGAQRAESEASIPSEEEVQRVEEEEEMENQKSHNEPQSNLISEEMGASSGSGAATAGDDDEEENEFDSDAGVVGGPAMGGTFDGREVLLQPQIVLPDRPVLQHLDNGQNYWPLHAIFKERGWAIATNAPPGKVTMWISKGAVPRLKRGYQMLNSMGVSGCIGGAKTLQLACRRRLATMHGCDYESLKIQPPQYNMLETEDCKRFFADASRPGLENKLYLVKPSYTFHGAGIKIYKGTKEIAAEFGTCAKPKHAIVMDYVADPATMGGYKYDFRSYLLVASLNPQLVFYHDGFVRRSDTKYDAQATDLKVHITNKITQSKEDHFFNFTQLGESLARDLGLPSDYLDTYIRPRAQAVSRFMFHTARVQPKPPAHFPGRWHLFGVDWLLDRSGKLHLLEGNGYPLVTHYPGIGLTPKIWQEMTDLVLAIHTDPERLGTKRLTVKDKFTFGGWKLVFNELEEEYEARLRRRKAAEAGNHDSDITHFGYNPCKEM